MVRSALANAYFFFGRAADSRDAFTRALATREKLFGSESPRLVVTLNNFADTLTKVGRHEEALALVERAVTIAKKAYPTGHPVVVATFLTHAEIQFALGRRDEAGKELEAVIAMQPPPIAPYLAEAGAVRSFIALSENKVKDALAFATKAVEAGTQVGARSPELVQPLLARGESELALKDSAAAVKTLELALSIVEEAKPWPVSHADVEFALARAKSAAKVEGAKKHAEDALAIYRASDGQDAKTKSVEEFLAQ
jgi:tetratricopeptide (TPR) repeat protein